MYTHMHARTHARMQTDPDINSFIHADTFKYVCVCVCVCVCMCVYFISLCEWGSPLLSCVKYLYILYNIHRSTDDN